MCRCHASHVHEDVGPATSSGCAILPSSADHRIESYPAPEGRMILAALIMGAPEVAPLGDIGIRSVTRFRSQTCAQFCAFLMVL